ncbi:GapPol polyprotein-like protein, partial [Leptotrombidium deliense]
TTPYHPSSNGLVEKLNGILKAVLTAHVNGNRKNWDILLPYAVSAYNATPHTSTEYAPYYLLYGIDYRQPIDNKLNVRNWSLMSTVEDMESNEIRELRVAREIALENIFDKAQYNVEKLSKRRIIPEISESQYVMLYNAPLRMKTKALWSPWEGPYVVIKRMGLNTYDIALVSDPLIRKVVNIEKLRVTYPRIEEDIVIDLVTLY